MLKITGIRFMGLWGNPCLPRDPEHRIVGGEGELRVKELRRRREKGREIQGEKRQRDTILGCGGIWER